jgi:hypothetical protein
VKRHLILFAAALFLLAVTPLSLVGCGTAEPGKGDGAVVTIEQALATGPGKLVKVKGAVIATEGRVVLASVLLESYPPQAGGPTLPVKGLDLDSLVGLSSTADQPDLAQVTWSDYWVVLEGVIEDGMLAVRKTPRVIETTSAGVRVRFSPVSEPLVAGESLWWAFDIENTGTTPLDVIFSSGQKGEVVLTQDGVEKYRWSAGKAFTEAIETVALQPGKVLSASLNDTARVAPGEYELTAVVTAAVGPVGGPGSPGSAIPLPELETAITVR